MSKRSVETTVGIFVIFGILCIAYMTLRLGNLDVLGGNYYTLKVRFSSITGLKPGSSVEMLGIQIGQVKRFTLDQENQEAIVEMKIRGGIKIYDDAIASIKTSGLIGDRYIHIDAGGSDVILKPGGTIIESEPPVDIEELISKYIFGGDK